MGTFGYCRNLSEVKLPASLKAIQSYVFGGCSGLKTVSYDGSLEQWNHITTNNDVLGYSCPSLVTDDYTAQFMERHGAVAKQPLFWIWFGMDHPEFFPELQAKPHMKFSNRCAILSPNLHRRH